MIKLSKQQELFTVKYFECGNGRESYLHAYPTSKKWTMEAVDVNASKLLKDTKVTLRLTELREEAAKPSILSFQRIQQLLTNKVEEELDNEGLKALDIFNRMAGHYEKDNKTEVFGQIVYKAQLPEKQ